MKQISIIVISLMTITGILAQTAIAPAVGNGTEGNPYEIASLENLYWIAASNDVVPNPNQAARWSRHYIQTVSIDASATSNWFGGQGWEPIGLVTTRFTGTYDGQGHVINALYINRPNSNRIGLFGRIEGATIENLGLINVNVTGGNSTGSLVGDQWESSLIVNCHSTGSVTGLNYVGGLVGDDWEGTYENNYSTVSVIGNIGVGGLVGWSYLSSISNSYSTGSVSGESAIGGLLGFNSLGIISNCYSTGNVTASGSQVGGLVGENDGGVDDAGIITNCYSRGNVSGDNDVGGLVGSNYGFINDCYSTGNVSGNEYVGGLVGWTGGYYGNVNNSHWNTETSGQTSSAGGEGRTTTEMTYPYSDNTYVAWNFEDIWAADIDYTINDGYPYLAQLPLSVEKEDTIVPLSQSVVTVYPNPFNPETTITLTLKQKDVNKPVTAAIYNLKGQRVRKLLTGEIVRDNTISLVWNGRNDDNRAAASGIYFIAVETASGVIMRKITLMK